MTQNSAPNKENNQKETSIKSSSSPTKPRFTVKTMDQTFQLCLSKRRELVGFELHHTPLQF